MGKKTNLTVTLTNYSVCLWRFTKKQSKTTILFNI